ncbi:MAG: serine hydrolase domain-containing protein [Planctomycetota bacterium]
MALFKTQDRRTAIASPTLLLPVSLLVAPTTFCRGDDNTPPANDPTPQANDTTPPTKRISWKRVDDFAKGQVERGEVQALSLGVWFEGQPTIRHYGQLAANDDRQPDDNTLYEIGSVTKVLTATLLADAIVRGEVDPDATLADLLPKPNAPLRPGVGKVRLLDLATHCSGLPRLPTNMTSLFDPNPYAPIDREKLLAGLSHEFLTLPENPTHSYSNFGAGVLGQLLADQAGKTYAELLRDRLLQPLEMNDTFVQVPSADMQRFAPPHGPNGKPGTRWEMNAMTPAGGVRSTLADMMKLAKAMLDPPDSPIGKAIQKTWRPLRKAGGRERVAMGWFVKPSFDIHWHNGTTGGYHSLVIIDRENGYASVVLSNRASFETSKIAKEIRFEQ